MGDNEYIVNIYNLNNNNKTISKLSFLEHSNNQQ